MAESTLNIPQGHNDKIAQERRGKAIDPKSDALEPLSAEQRSRVTARAPFPPSTDQDAVESRAQTIKDNDL